MEVCALLEAQGVACWIAPRDVAPGAKWDEAIVDAISNAGAFLLVLTAAANESPYVGNEVNHAFASKKPILTFRAEDVQPNKSLGFYLARHHWTDGFTGSLPQTVPQVAAAVTSLLGTAASGAASGVATVVAAPRPVSPARKAKTSSNLRPVRLAAGAVAVAVLAGAAAWYLKPAPPVAPQQVVRFTLALPDGERLAVQEPIIGPSSVVISPDGRYVAYVVVRGGTQETLVRPIDSADARIVPGSAGAVGPFFSPDASWIGMTAIGGLWKAPVGGGVGMRVTTTGGSSGAHWVNDGSIVLGGTRGLLQIPEGGGPERILVPNAGTVGAAGAYRHPHVLPGGRAVLFTMTSAQGPQGTVLYDVASGQRRDLIAAGTAPAYAPTGHIVYVQNGTLFALPFDLATMTATGNPVAVLQGLLQTASGYPYYSFSNTGTLVYVSGSAIASRRLVWVGRNGVEEPLVAPLQGYDWPRLSPDGGRVAVEIDGQTWVHDLKRETMTRLTFTGSQNDGPAWSADGMRIAVRSNRGGPPATMFWQMADGSGGDERLSPADQVGNLAHSFSPDGRLLAFGRTDPKTLRDIWVLSVEGRVRSPFLVTPATEGAARFSPDGRWIAYVSDESGRPEIFVQPFPGPGGKWQISTEGGIEPAWNSSGRELFYRNGTRMMAVPVTTQGTFAAGHPTVLFEGSYLASTFPLTGVTYDVTRDGQRFLMVKDETTSATQINVVVNWFEELKRLVPTE